MTYMYIVIVKKMKCLSSSIVSVEISIARDKTQSLVLVSIFYRCLPEPASRLLSKDEPIKSCLLS